MRSTLHSAPGSVHDAPCPTPPRLGQKAARAIVFLTWLTAAAASVAPAREFPTSVGASPSEPQLITSARLLKLGEEITLTFRVPPQVTDSELEIFPRYLESADPGSRYRAGGNLDWINALPHETVPVNAVDGRAEVRYRPAACGSYLARWRVADEQFVRYFAAIDDDWVVLRFSSFEGLEPHPTLHATGVPLDYRLPGDRFRPDDPLLCRFRDYDRHFGESIIPALPDTPTMTTQERVASYGEVLERVRRLLPDPSNARSARVDMRHDLDPGYTEALECLGVNDHCGLQEANAKPWLGMPEFPYFSSATDCRKTRQQPGGTVVAHQWDFCGGWHFIGPVSWHYKAASGEWAPAQRCIREGVEELVNLASASGHPAFAVPLYDGVVGPGYPNPQFTYAVPDSRGFEGDIRDAFIARAALDDSQISLAMSRGAAALRELGVTLDTFVDGSDNSHDGSATKRSVRKLGMPIETLDNQQMTVHLDGKSCLVTDVAALGDGDFTIGIWVKPEGAQTAWANLISSHNNSSNHDLRGVSLEQDGSHANRFYLIAGADTHWMGTALTTQLVPGSWQHFAVVRRGHGLTHYLNGKVTADGEVLDRSIVPATDPLRIGDWARGVVDPQHASSEPVTAMDDFVERYQRFVFFELPKEHKLAFARSIDIADYYQRHFETTPRTVFVSQTDHVTYDMWWLCSWCNDAVLVPRQVIPWETRMSTVFRLRNSVYPFKDPLSQEYILVEDQRRSIRFERECPNPVWWFDYIRQERTPQGSRISWTVTPDVTVVKSGWRDEQHGKCQTFSMRTSASWDDYAIAAWDLPVPRGCAKPVVQSNAKEVILARNRSGQWHAVLVFDLRPDATLQLTVNAPQ